MDFVSRAARQAQVLERGTGYTLLEQTSSAPSQLPTCEHSLLVSTRQGLLVGKAWEPLDHSIHSFDDFFLGGLEGGCYVHFKLLRSQQ